MEVSANPLDQKENIDNPAHPTITIVKWVDTLKLVVNDSHLNQWIPITKVRDIHISGRGVPEFTT